MAPSTSISAVIDYKKRILEKAYGVSKHNRYQLRQTFWYFTEGDRWLEDRSSCSQRQTQWKFMGQVGASMHNETQANSFTD